MIKGYLKYYLLAAFSIIPLAVFSQLPNHNMHVLANLNQHLTGDTYSGCWGYAAPNGREYAILGCPVGTSFIDITDSANIHEVYFKQTPNPGSGNHWREITVYSHYAYVVTEQSSCGIEIFDLQYLPDSVHYVRLFFPQFHTTTHSISFSGAFIYLNGCNAAFGQGVTVFDLTSNPENPVKRGALNTNYVHDCRVVNNIIYAACFSGGIRIINAQNKDSLQFITSFFTPPHFSAHNCALSPDGHYLFTTDETYSPYGGTLKVFNVGNFGNITFVNEWHPTNITTSQVHNVEIYGDTAVVAHRTAGVRVLNISNCSNPQEIAWYDTYPQNNDNAMVGTWGVFMFPSKKIICSNKETGLWVLKLDNNLTGIKHITSAARSFKLHQNYPNPFNPSTKIKFDIPNSPLQFIGEGLGVRLSVYNIMGQEIKTLVNESLKPGIYEVDLDASSYPAGIYFYKLTSGKFIDVKKMVLVK